MQDAGAKMRWLAAAVFQHGTETVEETDGASGVGTELLQTALPGRSVGTALGR